MRHEMRNIIRSVCIALCVASGTLAFTATQAWAQDRTDFDLSTQEGVSAFLARYFSAERRGDARGDPVSVVAAGPSVAASAERDPEDTLEFLRRLRDAASASSTLAAGMETGAEQLTASASQASEVATAAQSWADLMSEASAAAWDDARESGLASDRRNARRVSRLAQGFQDAAVFQSDRTGRLSTDADRMTVAAQDQRTRSDRISMTSRAIATQARPSLRD